MSGWPTDLPESVFLAPASEAKNALAKDPEGFFTNALVRAKWWLPKQKDLIEVKAAYDIAVQYAVKFDKTSEKTALGLTALEIQRRCERRIGEIIIDGREAGVFYSNDTHKGVSVALVLGLSKNQKYFIDRVSDMGNPTIDAFENGIELARKERNMSLANVLRRVNGKELTAIRSEWNQGKRHLDSNRIVQALADQLESAMTGIDHVEGDELEPALKKECVDSIRASLRSIMKEVAKW